MKKSMLYKFVMASVIRDECVAMETKLDALEMLMTEKNIVEMCEKREEERAAKEAAEDEAF